MLMDASRCFTLQSCTTSLWYQTLENPFPSPAAMSQSIALYFWPDIKIPQILGEDMDSQNNPNCLTRNWLEALCTCRNWLERKQTKRRSWHSFILFLWLIHQVILAIIVGVCQRFKRCRHTVRKLSQADWTHVDLLFIQPAMAMWKLH